MEGMENSNKDIPQWNYNINMEDYKIWGEENKNVFSDYNWELGEYKAPNGRWNVYIKIINL